MYKQQEERHRWLKGFTIGTLVVGVIAAWVVIANLGNLSSPADQAPMFWGFVIAVVCIWGPIWIFRKSDSFKRWSRLSGWQKFLSYVIAFPGFYVGIALILVLLMLPGELKKMSDDN